MSVFGNILLKLTVLTLHDPITSAHRLSFLQNCHHYCIFSADKSVCLCSGDLSHIVCDVHAADLSTGGFY